MNPNIKIKNLIKTLAKETNEAKKSESMKQYLTLMSKFHNYSYKNQLIIFSQNPKATRIAGIKTWQSLNRKVKKGEKSIVMPLLGVGSFLIFIMIPLIHIIAILPIVYSLYSSIGLINSLFLF